MNRISLIDVVRSISVATILSLVVSPSFAACPASPYTLVNGQPADANQLMANFNSLINCVNNNSTPLILPGYLSGLGLAWTNGTTFSVAAGIGANENGGALVPISLSAALSKTTATWSSGGGNGALDTGSVAANTWYHVHAIRKDSDGTADILLSLSPSAPTMPQGYAARRRIGSLKTNSTSQIIQFTQNGDRFSWYTGVADVTSAAAGTSAVVVALPSVPSGVVVSAVLNVGLMPVSANYNTAIVSSLDTADIAPVAGNSATFPGASTVTVGTSGWMYGYTTVRTNTNAQVRYRLAFSGATERFGIFVLGWDDPRGKN